MDEFETWWAETWKSPEAPPALQAAFKEIAQKAWTAGYEEGRQVGHSEGWDERDEAGY